jgi:hypothetical protein
VGGVRRADHDRVQGLLLEHPLPGLIGVRDRIPGGQRLRTIRLGSAKATSSVRGLLAVFGRWAAWAIRPAPTMPTRSTSLAIIHSPETERAWSVSGWPAIRPRTDARPGQALDGRTLVHCADCVQRVHRAPAG